MKKMILNPDEKVVNAIQNRLKVTSGQCPCIPPYLQSEDTICPCKSYREEQHCCCNLYVEVFDKVEWLKKAINKLYEEAQTNGLTMRDLADSMKEIVQQKNATLVDIGKIEGHVLDTLLTQTADYVELRSANIGDTYVFDNGSEQVTVLPTHTISVYADIDDLIKNAMDYQSFIQGISDCVIDFIQEYIKTNNIIITPKCIKMVIEHFVVGYNGNIEMNVGLQHFK